MIQWLFVKVEVEGKGLFVCSRVVYFPPVPTSPYVFGLEQEARESEENPHRHGENVLDPDRKAPGPGEQ